MPEAPCQHVWRIIAALGGTCKHCEKCGRTVKIEIPAPPTQTKN